MLPRRRPRAPGGRGRRGAVGHRAGGAAVVAAALLAGTVAVGGPAAATPARAGGTVATAPATPNDPEQPLHVTLDTLSPAVVPQRGPVQVTGSVTNRSDESWRDVNVYAFSGSEPITSAAGLDAAIDTAPAAAVGTRVVAPRTFDSVERLDPGDSAGFTVRVPRERLGIPDGRAGVYWFGVHALGTTADGRDGIADGRARTFLTQVGGDNPQLPVSLVLPLRAPVVHAADGSIARVEEWVEELDTDGGLRSLLDFAAAGSGRSLTWLVDPSVLDAVDRLAAGNPSRSLAPTLPEPTDPDSGASPSDGATTSSPDDGASPSGDDGGDSGAPSAGSSPDDTSSASDPSRDARTAATTPTERRAAELADVWGKRLRELLDKDEVLALPYADLDVTGALQHEPGAYARAASFSSETLGAAGISSSPVFAPPSGSAGVSTLEGLAEGTTVLLPQTAVEEGDSPGPPAREIAGRDVVLTDPDAVAGGPGPDDPQSGVQVRQRLLAETALRSLAGDDSAVVAVLPDAWVPADPRGFFTGVQEAGWIRLVTASTATAGAATTTDPEALLGRDEDAPRPIGRRQFAAVRNLTAKGVLLEEVLARNNVVGDVVARQALAAASYRARDFRLAWRRINQRAARAITAQLTRVRVEAPPSVTLSSEEGKFAASLTNDLGEPVLVRIEARTDSPVELSAPESIALEPGETTTVLLTARTTRIGLHDVELVVTAPDGVPLGSRAELPIRSAQVSWIIWVVIAVGATMLFGAILLRLVRRLLARRGRTAAAPGGAA